MHIVLRIINADGLGYNGLIPTHQLKKTWELRCSRKFFRTLLSTAIGKITGTSKMIKQSPERIQLFYRC
jgi:hypothetical protein